jgi:hypothetical protein
MSWLSLARGGMALLALTISRKTSIDSLTINLKYIIEICGVYAIVRSIGVQDERAVEI